MPSFGETIKDLRLGLGLTKVELAKRCKMSTGFITGLESGTMSPPLQETLLRQLAESLNANALWLIYLARRDRKEVTIDLEGLSDGMRHMLCELATRNK